MKEKIMLITGCSHASGSEIDGTEDSKYNRTHSFGNCLAEKIGYKPINIASVGATNSGIARTVLEWFNSNYDSKAMELFVLVSWTEGTRMEAPFNRDCLYDLSNKYADWSSASSSHYLRINLGYEGMFDDEKKIIKEYHRFIAKNTEFTEILSLNLILQLQYFFKSKKVEYLMCNAMPVFGLNKYTTVYYNLIDKQKYIDVDDSKKAFYWYYRDKGYLNKKAKYWHHGEVPHQLYSEKLFNFLNH